MSSRDDITRVFDSMRDLVLEKNKRYGDSALSPLCIFATPERMADPSITQAQKSIYIRLDDKLSRIANSTGAPKKNDLADSMGYISLACTSHGYTDFTDLID